MAHLLSSPSRPSRAPTRVQGPWLHAREPCTIPDLDEPRELGHNRRWRAAVWALRVGYLGLAVAVAGLVVMVSGSTPWILAFGEVTWLAAAVTVTAFLRARNGLPRSRPGYRSMRFMLIHDSVHARSSTRLI
jgi:hypothetical protein